MVVDHTEAEAAAKASVKAVPIAQWSERNAFFNTVTGREEITTNQADIEDLKTKVHDLKSDAVASSVAAKDADATLAEAETAKSKDHLAVLTTEYQAKTDEHNAKFADRLADIMKTPSYIDKA